MPGDKVEFLPVPPREAYDSRVVPTPTPILPSFRRPVGCLMQAIARRLENRIPLTVRVDLCSLDVRHPAREGLTENVSDHGARVVSSTPWKLDERLNVWSLPGDFRARARVVYCETLGSSSFAIGLQLLASAGGWK
jgi:PilZ domain-containing protein